MVLGKRTLKNIGGGATEEVKDLSAALVEHRRAFLDQGIITTEITAFQILDDVGIISAKVDWISTRLEWVSSQVSDAGTQSRWLVDFMGYRTDNRRRTSCKYQRNPIWNRLAIHTRQGLSYGNADGLPRLHCELGERSHFGAQSRSFRASRHGKVIDRA